MRTLILTALAAVGLAILSHPASAVPAGPVSGISAPSGMLTEARMRRRPMRRGSMTWVQRKGSRR